MILYQLRCSHGHNFEAWFLDSATYETQAATGDIDCPYCGDTGVSKAPMAPRLLRRRGEPAAIGEGNPEKGGERRAQEVARQILRAFEKVREHVEKNAEYVGERFADEARAIHYGERDRRDIYGEATDDEAEELAEEGVEFARIPWPRRKRDS